MKKLFFLGVLVFFVASSAWAGIPGTGADLQGFRTTPGDSGLNATGKYIHEEGGVKIAWDIQYNSTSGYWNYAYTITDEDESPIDPELSHWIVELSPEIPLDQDTIVEFIFQANAQVVTPGGEAWLKDPDFPNTLSPGGGISANPNLGTDLHGVKFDTVSQSVSGTYTFKSVEPPVWGDVYLK